MRRLKVGIIGLGVGWDHIEGYKRNPCCELAALCDLDREKKEKALRAQPEAKFFTRAEELLDDSGIDVLSIASFDDHHYEQVVRGLENGKHLFVEKPVCQSREQLAHIRGILEKNPGLLISSNLILRMSPRFRQVREMIRDGEMGRIYYLEGDYNYGRLHKITDGWRGKLDHYSVTCGGGIHLVDLLLWFLGERPEEVVSMGNGICSRGTGFQYEDFVVSLLRFPSGAVAKVASNFGCVYPHFHRLSVYGTDATFENRTPDGLFYRSRDSSPPKAVTAAYPGYHKADLIPSFVDSILDGTPAEVGTEDVFDTLSVCFAIDQALQTGRPTRVDYI